MEKDGWLYQLAALPPALPDGVYRLDCDWTREQRLQASLGWGLAAYRFERYKANGKARPSLLLDDDIAEDVRALCERRPWCATWSTRRPSTWGPRTWRTPLCAKRTPMTPPSTGVVTGDDLLTDNFPAIHAVGRASSRAPRLVELTWGDEDAPLLCLVGKGVCFDTGGLDLKTASGMALMKKDMGGAAHALALARLVMGAGCRCACSC
jgi:leucyl aminopeptidase